MEVNSANESKAAPVMDTSAPGLSSVITLGRNVESDGVADAPPISACLPKQETGAEAFLRAYPDYDGRGVVIGILDTGVDPGAAGLQVTTDGKPKILDIIDCTGSGDVDMSKRAAPEKDEDGNFFVTALSGRKLLLNPEWVAAGGGETAELRLGVKHAYDILPRGLKRRLQRERREAWDKEQGSAVASVTRAITEEKEKPEPTASVLEDLEIQLEELQSFADKYDDSGPVFDCVAFLHAESASWYGYVDTAESGDLRQCKAMRDFDKDREWRSMEGSAALNYGLHFYDDGKTLSIVNDVGAHGTHVAAITAAHHPDAPLLNGVAPGAQIVSLRIGDSRLGSMETGTGIVRALLEAKRIGCHMLNMSYGEAAAVTNKGYFVDLANEVVREHGMLLVGSAGNNGPALSTVGCPGGTTDGYIGVAAYVSPKMAQMLYSSLGADEDASACESQDLSQDNATFEAPVPGVGQNYTWSSVGPAPDGERGVSISAPGGAFTSVPLWTQQRSQLMNGTSMSSPNACGNIALLLSAQMQKGLSFSPPRIRRAIEITAKALDGVNVLKQGHGLLQVGDAYDYLDATSRIKVEDFSFNVEISGAGDNHNGSSSAVSQRGIYLRQPGSISAVQTAMVRVTPVFRKEASNEERVGFEMLAGLESSQPWIVSPEYVVLTHGGNSFDVRIDPTKLPPGVHFGFVKGVDLGTYEGTDLPSTRAPLFEAFVTVIVPHNMAERKSAPAWDYDVQHTIAAGALTRTFLQPPQGATWAEVSISRVDEADTDAKDQDRLMASRLIVLHCLQLLPQHPYREAETQSYLRLYRNDTRTSKVRLEPGHLVEVDVGQYWSSLGVTSVRIGVRFRGVTPTITSPHLQAGCGMLPVELQHDATCPRHERLKPSLVFRTFRRTLAPKSATVVCGGERYLLFDGKSTIHSLVLKYEFKASSSGNVKLSWPTLNDELYESPFVSQLFVLFDANKKLCGCGDAWSDKVSVGKGMHYIHLVIRHHDVKVLKSMEALPCAQIWDLPKGKITCDTYYSRAEAVTSGSRASASVLHPGSRQLLWIREPPRSALAKIKESGDLLGSITYTEDIDGGGKRPSGSRDQVAGWPVTYMVDATLLSSPADRAAGPATADPPVPPEEAYRKAAREAAVKHLKSLVGKEDFPAILELAVADHGEDLQFLVAAVDHKEAVAKKSKTVSSWNEAAEACTQVVSRIDEAEIARHFGIKHDLKDPAAKLEHKQMEKKRESLVKALRTAAGCHVNVHKLEKSEDAKAAFLSTMGELAKWEDVKELKYSDLLYHKHTLEEKKGAALKVLAQVIGHDDPNACKSLSAAEAKTIRSALFAELGWHHIAKQEELSAIVAAPANHAVL
eukprot:scaffold1651_cov317-Pinguiococcus_pyrenoidosus.AAC.18